MKNWQPYSEYKDSGIDWLGEVPELWEVMALKHACFESAVYGANISAENYLNHGIRFIRTSDIDDFGDLSLDNAVYLDPLTVDDKHILKNNELLVSRSGTIGRSFVYLISKHGDCAYAGYLVRFSPNKKLDSNYAFYFTKSLSFNDWLHVSVIESTIGNLNGQKYANMHIPIPPIHEQRAIADFLDHQTAKINALIAKKQRLIELLQEKRAALISRAVTKGLDPTVPMKDSGVEWVGEIPEHWEVARIKFVARLESGHTPSRQHPEYWVNCTIPWISLADVWQLRNENHLFISETKEKVSELGLANSSARLLQEGTVILSRTASVGFSGVMSKNMATTQDYVNWVCGPKLRPLYLLFVLRSMHQEFARLTMGSTHKTIYMPDVRGFSTPIAPITEQEQIIECIQDETEKIDRLLLIIRTAIEKLQEYRTALISAAVTGKIDVRGYAPSP